jgi:hypothetical protein
MPGKLVVLVRANPTARWTLVAAALSPSEAQAAVDAVIATNTVVRVVVAQVVRSFVTTAQATEDAIATVDP